MCFEKCHLKGKSCRKWANGLKVGNSEKNLDPRGWSAPTPGQYTYILQKYSKIFSETTWLIKAQFYRKHLWEGGTNVFINYPGHMTKMATMPIYGKNPSKVVFSRTTGPISTKLGMKHRGLKPFKILLLRNHWTDFNETWHEASGSRGLQCVYKL